jgi:hypothetical protein
MKRRIEITREHTTRIQLVQPGPAECPQCRRPLALAPVEVVAVAELTRPQLEAALRGKRPTDEAIAAAASAVHDTAAPISDVRGSDGYRRAMIEVIARRAIAVAARRAAGEHVSVPATMTVGGTR